MRGVDSTTSNAFMAAWAAAPSFFWLRGIWRDKISDRWLAGVLFFVFALWATEVDHTTGPLNTAGGFLIILGILTMLAGPLGKKMPFRRAADYGVVCIIVGVLLGMLI